MEEVCGTCKWNCRTSDGEYGCGNDESEMYGVSTFYDDTCDDWEKRE